MEQAVKQKIILTDNKQLLILQMMLFILRVYCAA